MKARIFNLFLQENFIVITLLLFIPAVSDAQNSNEIKGSVKDEASKEPLPGVTVQLKGSNTGTTTKANGEFMIAAAENDVIVFSLIGYGSIEEKAGKGPIHIQLTKEAKTLEDLVITGYGTQRKKDVTGAVTRVSAAKLENENPNTVQDLLRGNAPGLNIGFNATAKGGGDLEVRGRKSLNAGGQPLLVVDGTIYIGELSDINPVDIETIDVLKDASSTAVFGAKAANGVIMIVTRKGKKGKPVINLNSSLGLATMSVNQPINSPDRYISWRTDVMNSTQSNHKPYQFNDPRTLPPDITLAQWLAYDNSNGDPVTVWLQRLNFKQVELDNYKAGKSINWYDKMFRSGLQQDYNVSLSNSTDNVSYYWSLGYQDIDGVVEGDKYKTIRSRLNLEAKVTGFLKVGLNSQFSFRDESQVPVDWPQMVMISPWGSEFNDDGTLRFSPQDDPVGIPLVSRNPLLDPAYTNRSQKYYTLNSSLYAILTLPLGITYQVNFTPRFEWYNYLNHISSKDPQFTPVGGIATRTQSFIYNWQVDNLVKWNKNINNIHRFDVTFLFNAEKYQSWRNAMSNNRFNPNDQLGYSNISAGINPTVASNDEYSTGDALMGRFNYSLKEKYLLSLSVRRDGYSAFGQSNPRATFPAAAVGWVFTNEAFFKNINWLNRGKLRLSYGLNGNRDIGRYAALSQLASGNYLNVSQSGVLNTITTLELSTMSNTGLRWEKTAAYNAGFDFSIFGNLIEGSIDAYSMSTTDLLVQRTLPTITGYKFVMANLGEVSNKGFEINLNSRNINRPNFTWNTTVNFILNRNKIVSLYGDMEDIKDGSGNIIGEKERDDVGNRWFIGHAIDEIWDLKVLGVWQTNEKDQAAKYGVRPGDFKIQDVNSDGLYTNADRQFLGYREPRFRWTLRNDFSFLKSFNFSFMLYSYWGQSDTFNIAKGVTGYSGAGYGRWTGYSDRNSAYVLPYWTPENPINDYARISSSFGGAVFNVYRKKSFIRLDNIALAYTVPKNILQKIKMQGVKIFFTVKNVGFYSPGSFLWDPEYYGPTPRTYTTGINLTL